MKQQRITKPKTFYLAAQMKSDGGGYYAYILPVSTEDNLKYLLERQKSLLSLSICRSRYEAEELVRAWNAAFKQEGRFLFDE